VQRICNRIALIHHGEIKLQGELDKLEKEMGEGKVEVETAEEVSEIHFKTSTLILDWRK